MIAMLKVLLVDDHAVFREGLRSLLDLEEDFDVVGEASCGDEALAMVADVAPDVILLDLHLPDGSGADFCRDRPMHKSLPIVNMLMTPYRNYLGNATIKPL